MDQRGFSSIIRQMADSVFTANDSRLVLNEEVAELHYDLRRYAGRPLGVPRHGVFVRTRSGRCFWARFCICTYADGVIEQSVH